MLFIFLAYDICLLYLETELEFNDDVKYIDLEVRDPEPGTMCDISGWGLLEVSWYQEYIPTYIL